jgi:hypothetical protein
MSELPARHLSLPIKAGEYYCLQIKGIDDLFYVYAESVQDHWMVGRAHKSCLNTRIYNLDYVISIQLADPTQFDCFPPLAHL